MKYSTRTKATIDIDYVSFDSMVFISLKFIRFDCMMLNTHTHKNKNKNFVLVL